ncbi:RNA polymerase sigma factor [Phyllobacterium sp. SB3]|uniref:RNA polymerase sigma factor n=1 Tax=Phyllobacterium sp. SB3 TaxID=3156073 RepID=UPI0032AEE8D3
MTKVYLANLAATFAAIRPRLERVAHARTRSREAAEDLVQDTWLKLERSSGQELQNPAGFITRVAMNIVADHLRKEARRSKIDAEVTGLLWETEDLASPERIVLGQEKLEAVRSTLAELPEKTRSIFLMNRLDGISHRKIAMKLGISDEAVYYHIRRALERLAHLRDDIAD